MLEEVLRIREKLLGPDDLEVASTIHGLANTDLGLGNYAEAGTARGRARPFARRSCRRRFPPVTTVKYPGSDRIPGRTHRPTVGTHARHARGHSTRDHPFWPGPE
jgi:hypothetical protein